MTSEPKDNTIESVDEMTKSQDKDLIGPEPRNRTEASEEKELFSIDSRWFELVFYSSIFVWIAWLVLQTRGWAFEDRLFPRMLGITLVLLLVVQIMRVLFPERIASLKPHIRKESTFEIDGNSGDRPKYERQKYELLMIAWVISLPLLLQYIGFLLTVPLYLFAFLVYFLRDLSLSAIITTVTSVVIYLLFVVVLNMQFPA